MSNVERLKLEKVGPIRCADLELGDLTVLVGPQATGKSIFLQFLKLALDVGYVHEQLRRHGIDWDGAVDAFLNVYLGAGMASVWRTSGARSTFAVNKEPQDLERYATVRKRKKEATAFYIPAQRVLSLANGWPRPFQGFAGTDPFVLRDFSESVRLLLEQEFSATADLFPKTKRLKSEYRELLRKHVFGEFELKVDRYGSQKQLVLSSSEQRPSIPFLAWSAGQREFVPLLLGIYWILPPAKTSRRENLRWVIIEEPEMGLHPRAISVVLLLVLEMMSRGYRVCVSTHSPCVLDLVWALQVMTRHKSEPVRLLELFEVRKSDPMKKVGETVLSKKAKVYYFDRAGMAHDISNLDPASPEAHEADWGGLSELSGRAAEMVAQVVNAEMDAQQK